ncbi:DUF1360 domain-containing protein [Streptomyces minutiscleroticus]|uniref:Integral membrane protein n=1 Tax=Streptomyces minutiscleroticus TaxID=68238 RepID=A0A918KTE3_9ACTN|nr:DUF1360 domain-containing protein [Streptomyces minutiscleroticus]GGX73619.1 hypothetical protein GCM10010358_30190 [Streptomyces minutiscleroticus]
MSESTDDYNPDGDVPLGGYAALATTFAAAAGLAAVALRARKKALPDRVPPWDVLLLGVSTYKLSRLLAKDKITSFVRAPFTRREEDTTAGEVSDEPRGEGLRLAVGDLVACPFCVSAWMAGSLTAGYAFAPRATRLVASGLTAMTLSDWLHYAWTWTQQRVEG